MNDEAALLAAILANRADDTPRLVYADWCDENGHPERAEFIRVQVELERQRLTFGVSTPTNAFKVLDRRSSELIGAWCNVWFRFDERPFCWNKAFGRDESSCGPLCVFPTVSRGFVSHITCSWSDWHTHADAITASQPIERVKLTTNPPPRHGIAEMYLKARWPRIEFELPQAAPQVWPDEPLRI